MELKDKESMRGYVRGYDKEVILTCRVFTNRDGSTGRLYVVCSDTSLSGDHIATIYQKRWKVEEYHKSFKSNAALAKSPTKRATTQISHLVMSMIAVFKLECLKIKRHMNHFALRAKILIKAKFSAMAELEKLQDVFWVQGIKDVNPKSSLGVCFCLDGAFFGGPWPLFV